MEIYTMISIAPSSIAKKFENGSIVKLRDLLSAALKGRPGHSPTSETRAKISAAHKGRPVTPETRAKMSAAHKGRPVTPESRAKISAAHKGRPVIPETRAKMSAAKKYFWIQRHGVAVG
jgi:hypothetical protein